MNKLLCNYVDRILIDKYAMDNKLDINFVPEHEILYFLYLLMDKGNENMLREVVLVYMQKCIDERLQDRNLRVNK